MPKRIHFSTSMQRNSASRRSARMIFIRSGNIALILNLTQIYSLQNCKLIYTPMDKYNVVWLATNMYIPPGAICP